MSLTLNIGSPAVSLVQKSAVVVTNPAPGGPVAGTLPSPSTAGTALVAIVGASAGGLQPVASFPAGWTQLAVKGDVANGISIEAWIYPNNPGGISAIAITASSSSGLTSRFEVLIGEFLYVQSASATVLDTSGTATSSAGTTLSPATTGHVSSTGELAIAAWRQRATLSGDVTFTTPSGWTRLGDSGTAGVSQSGHLDAEYLVNPTQGSTVGPTLTSTGTTSIAVGLIVALRSAPPFTDQTAFIGDASMNIKLNTFDVDLILGGRFQLEDGSGYYQLEDGSGSYLLETVTPSLGDQVALTNPTWSGRVVSVKQRDLENLITNYKRASITATNSAVAVAGVAAVDLSDSPGLSYFVLEDGTGDYLLEDGSSRYLLEGSSVPYRNLTVQQSQNQDGTVVTYGSLETFQSGFAAGQTFLLTSTNFGIAAQQYAITNVNISFLHTTPLYLIEFGDAYPTLQKAGGGVLTQSNFLPSQQAGIIMPAGTLGYSEITDPTNLTALPDLTDITGLSSTVTIASSARAGLLAKPRRIRIRGMVTYTKHTAGLLALDLYEGTNRLSQWIITAVDAASYTAHVDYISTPPAGAHTYKLTVGVSVGTADVTCSTSLPNFLIVEDVGV